MTAHIDPDAHIMTLINVFTVDSDKQQRLIDMLDEATESVMKRQPGFISANIHKSADGKRVINYAQWRRKEDFASMQKNPEATEHMKRIADLAKFEPIVCEVISSHS
jgi:heme-degrading monooxygenase HmoA